MADYPLLKDSTGQATNTALGLLAKDATLQDLIAAIGLQNQFLGISGAGLHNSLYRGKYLGSSVTAAQWAAINAGTFEDIYIGDYWTINGVNWRVADFDYWLNTGDTQCTTHHIVIVPDTCLLAGNGSTTHYMNVTDTTQGGYMGSGYYSGKNSDNSDNTAKAQVKTMIDSAFSSAHILTHREYLVNAMADGHPSGGAWADSNVELMNERMVYGNPVFEAGANGVTLPALFTIDKSQLALFAHEPSRITNRANWWLRDPVSASRFAGVDTNGDAYHSGASSAWLGIRPAFGIC